MLKVYLSGVITGDNNYKSKFKRAEDYLKERGLEVINPAELNEGVEGYEWQDYMKADIKALLDCDAIFLIKGYESSKGALIEKSLAEGLGLIVMYDHRVK